MKVRDILATVVIELNLDDYIKRYIKDAVASPQGLEPANNLLACFNMVENALAVEYLPLYAEDEIFTETGAVFYEQLTQKPIRIVRVLDEGKNAMQYQIFPEYIKTQPGKITVRYTYAPKEKTLDDECDYRLEVYKSVLLYGTANEYCLACGRFEEAEIWEKRYRRALKDLYKMKPSIILKSRRWA